MLNNFPRGTRKHTNKIPLIFQYPSSNKYKDGTTFLHLQTVTSMDDDRYIKYKFSTALIYRVRYFLLFNFTQNHNTFWRTLPTATPPK